MRSLLSVRCDNQNTSESVIGALQRAPCALLERGEHSVLAGCGGD